MPIFQIHLITWDAEWTWPAVQERCNRILAAPQTCSTGSSGRPCVKSVLGGNLSETNSSKKIADTCFVLEFEDEQDQAYFNEVSADNYFDDLTEYDPKVDWFRNGDFDRPDWWVAAIVERTVLGAGPV